VLNVSIAIVFTRVLIQIIPPWWTDKTEQPSDLGVSAKGGGAIQDPILSCRNGDVLCYRGVVWRELWGGGG
jgi:hypothetical protein